MFGMLDYRAHKLYSFLCFPFSLVLWILVILLPLSLPWIIYSYLKQFHENPIVLFLIGVVAYEVASVFLQIILKVIFKFPEAVFNFLVDPIPTDGRTKEESKLVVQGGERTLALLKLNNPACEWSDYDIERVSKLTFWHKLFSEKIERRLTEMRDCYDPNQGVAINLINAKEHLTKIGLWQGWIESFLLNPVLRSIFFRYVIFFASWSYVASHHFL